jgi:peptidoglycan/LPS O-acetylase OafA/YrhL
MERLLQQLTGLHSGWQLFAFSVPAVLACAAASWWLIERPCLKLKKISFGALAQRVRPSDSRDSAAKVSLTSGQLRTDAAEV